MAETAKLFMHGRSQAVRLPKEYRLPGTEVRVRRVGHTIVLEPLETPPFDVDGWWADLDTLGAPAFLMDDPAADPPVEPDDTISCG